VISVNFLVRQNTTLSFTDLRCILTEDSRDLTTATFSGSFPFFFWVRGGYFLPSKEICVAIRPPRRLPRDPRRGRVGFFSDTAHVSPPLFREDNDFSFNRGDHAFSESYPFLAPGMSRLSFFLEAAKIP